MPVTPNTLIYDEDCFFCSNYVRLLKLKASIGDITLVNARDEQAVKALQCNPRDLNEGMVLILGDKRYIGAHAIHHLALLSTSSDIFNKINYLVFKNATLSHLLYPVLKLGRRVYLLLAGKAQIR